MPRRAGSLRQTDVAGSDGHGRRVQLYSTRQTFSMLVPPGYPMGSPQVMA